MHYVGCSIETGGGSTRARPRLLSQVAPNEASVLNRKFVLPPICSIGLMERGSRTDRQVEGGMQTENK